MKRIRSLFILCIGLLLFLFLWKIKPNCIFKELFGIPCPACGMTRAFECIFNFDFINAFYYNILAIPLFVLALIFIAILIYDLITNNDLFFKILFKFLEKSYLVIIVLIIISFIINLIKNI